MSQSLRRFGFSLIPLLCAGCAEPAHVPLTVQLSDPDTELRRDAALALGSLGAEGQPAVAGLIAAAGDPEMIVRQAACRALGEVGVANDEVLTALEGNLDDPQLSVRLAAALAMLKLKPDAESPRNVLNSAMQQGEGGTIVAVGKMGAAGRWALPVLIKLLRDHRPGIRRITADAIGQIGPDAAAMESLRLAATKDADDRVRAAAVAAMASRPE